MLLSFFPLINSRDIKSRIICNVGLNSYVLVIQNGLPFTKSFLFHPLSAIQKKTTILSNPHFLIFVYSIVLDFGGLKPGKRPAGDDF